MVLAKIFVRNRELYEQYIQDLEMEADWKFLTSITSKDIFLDPFVHFSLHQSFLKDRHVILKYKMAITENHHLFRDKIVLDVHCGIGLLSMFAIKAGAKHVYAIDTSHAVRLARSNTVTNKMTDRITVLLGDIDDVVLPVKEVDVILTQFRW